MGHHSALIHFHAHHKVLLFLNEKYPEYRDPDHDGDIAEQLGVPPVQILFLSDIHQELDAAEEAGLRTVQLIRGDDDAASHHHQVPSFDHIKPEQIPS